ncbi:MAG: hypothetical protein RLY72_2135 [Planctomycetota bacterium]|jgi:hypothetical protein
MKVALVPRIAVPTGTAAATVVMRETTGDPATDARRFIALAALDDEMLRGTFEELIVGGIYTVLVGRVLVLRVNHAGVRSIAAVVAIGGPSPTDVATNGATNVASNSTPHPPRAGLVMHPTIHGTDASLEATIALRALLDGETKQRPVFHAMTPEGVTYSGFDAQDGPAILQALSDLILPAEPASSLAIAFAGPSVDIPDGLVVGFGPAPA